MNKYIIGKFGDDLVLLSYYKNIAKFSDRYGRLYLKNVKVIAHNGENIEIENSKWRLKNSKQNFMCFTFLKSEIKFQTLGNITDDESAKLIFEVGGYE